jgi:hypothetical protein
MPDYKKKDPRRKKKTNDFSRGDKKKNHAAYFKVLHSKK